MSGYTQLTREERYQIYILKKDNYSQTEFSHLLGRDKSRYCQVKNAGKIQDQITPILLPSGAGNQQPFGKRSRTEFTIMARSYRYCQVN